MELDISFLKNLLFSTLSKSFYILWYDERTNVPFSDQRLFFQVEEILESGVSPDWTLPILRVHDAFVDSHPLVGRTHKGSNLTPNILSDKTK